VVTEDDSPLVKRARGGDIDAFEELVERHRAVVFRVAARVVGPDSADDVSQDALLRAYHRLDSYRGEGSFRAWLLRIVHNTALNQLERRVPEPVGGSDEVEQAAPARTGGREPASRLEERERAERLELKLRVLRPEHRTVLVLRDLEGMAYEEIAEITDSPLGSVKGRLHRARNELIDILRNNTYDWELPQ
jgi:RNA polymerase sigma-70 factor (ECF subfamily)